VSEVILYSRAGCHLCVKALEAIAALHAEGYRFSLREVDIESDDLLLRRLLERIPVVELDGAVVSELVFDADALRARLDTVRADDGAGGAGA
jgi:glutaredoxin